MPLLDTERFTHVRRMRDNRFPHEIAAILPGEFFVSTEPMVVYTVLGSCISACIRDSRIGIGGMNHFMLPVPAGECSGDKWDGEPTRYGSFAMEQLINSILKRGGSKQWLEIKLFGAGKIYPGTFDVGARNAEWVLRYLQEEGLPVVNSDLGDTCPRKIYYFTDTGRVLMKKLRRLKNDTIIERESGYEQRLWEERQHPPSDATLF